MPNPNITPGSMFDAFQDERYGKQNLDVFAQGIINSQTQPKSVRDRLLDVGTHYENKIQFEKAWRQAAREQLIEKGGTPGTQEFESQVEAFRPNADAMWQDFQRPAPIPVKKGDDLWDPVTKQFVGGRLSENEQKAKNAASEEYAKGQGDPYGWEQVHNMGVNAKTPDEWHSATKDVFERLTSTGMAQKAARDDAAKMQMDKDKAGRDERELALKEKEVAAKSNQDKSSAYLEEKEGRTLSAVQGLKNKVSHFTVGGGGSALRWVPLVNTEAKDFNADLNSLKANIAFSELAAMRNASKTGGALGSVSDKELTLLESTLAGLDLDQSPKHFADNLQKIEDSLKRWNTAVSKEGTGKSKKLTPAIIQDYYKKSGNNKQKAMAMAAADGYQE